MVMRGLPYLIPEISEFAPLAANYPISGMLKKITAPYDFRQAVNGGGVGFQASPGNAWAAVKVQAACACTEWTQAAIDNKEGKRLWPLPHICTAQRP